MCDGDRKEKDEDDGAMREREKGGSRKRHRKRLVWKSSTVELKEKGSEKPRIQ